MSKIIFPQKLSSEVLDYSLDFQGHLAVGETFETDEVVVLSGGVTLVKKDLTGVRETFWLSGGTPGLIAKIECRLTTSLNRVISAIAVVPVA